MSDGQRFLAMSRGFLNEEYRIKLRRAVTVMPEEALWWRANPQSNSVGNLLLHLAGNVRQWILSGIGGAPDGRDRAAEFAAREGATAEQLLAYVDTVLAQADAVIAALTPADLSSRRTIQGRDLTVLEAVYTVVQHFAMHLGQIIFVAKQQAPDALRFYEDAGGLARPIWR